MSTDSTRADVRIMHIDQQSAGQRVDNVLARELKGVPKSFIYRILRKGEVRVNKGRVKPDYRLRAGDQLRIPPLRLGPRARSVDLPPKVPPKSLLARLGESVIYEDESLLVLNKPSGVPVHSGSGVHWGVIELMRHVRPELPRLELVHRLDRDTSGCLLLAKSLDSLRELHLSFRQHHVTKRYLALVKGRWLEKCKIEAPLRRSVLRGGERMVEVSAHGKPALTFFSPIANYSDATLVEAALETGRTHQIRAHAAYAGYPLAGDRKYGCDQFNYVFARRGLRRLFLHAHAVGVPRDGEELLVHAELSADLRQIIDSLESG